jgi:hypothetical protein
MSVGIFVTARDHFEGAPGGVQTCTQEYVDVIKAAGFDLKFCLLGADRRISTRFLRQLNSSRYFRPAQPDAISAVLGLAREVQPDFVFFNQVAVAALAPKLRPSLPAPCRFVALSHGLESTDLLHFIRLRNRYPLSGRIRPEASYALGSAILTENRIRNHLDAVCALSPFDVELENWVGAVRVGWLPRIINPVEFDWRPRGDRFGFVGTLDHGPNLEGLVTVLDEIAANEDLDRFRVRVVGGSTSLGQWLARKYSCVDYLGRLEDDELHREATTWNAFLHPIFCHARGCSTKLATAMSWRVPIVTTTSGHRGYEWLAGGLVVADDPATFVRRCIEMRDESVATQAKHAVEKLAESSPKIAQVAARFRDIVGAVAD